MGGREEAQRFPDFPKGLAPFVFLSSGTDIVILRAQGFPIERNRAGRMA